MSAAPDRFETLIGNPIILPTHPAPEENMPAFATFPEAADEAQRLNRVESLGWQPCRSTVRRGGWTVRWTQAEADWQAKTNAQFVATGEPPMYGRAPLPAA